MKKWKLDFNGDTQEFVLSDPDSGKIIVVFETLDIDSDEERMQIIRALHVAPDMLEALEDVYEDIFLHENNRRHAKIRKIIERIKDGENG